MFTGPGGILNFEDIKSMQLPMKKVIKQLIFPKVNMNGLAMYNTRWGKFKFNLHILLPLLQLLATYVLITTYLKSKQSANLRVALFTVTIMF